MTGVAGAPSITSVAVLLVLGSAGLHTAWNVALKQVSEKRTFNAGLLIGSALWGAPAALWLMAHGHVPRLLPLGMALTTSVLWLLYYELLSRSYERGDLSVCYPVIRGVSPLAAAVFGLMLGERPTLWGTVGVAAIIVAVWFLSGAPIRLRDIRRANIREAVFVGVISAVYSAIDDRGVSYCHPVVYMWCACVPAALWLSLFARWKEGGRALRTTLVGRAPTIAWASFCGYASYLMVLGAMTQAHVMYVVPLRATAVLFSVAVGGLALGEPAMLRRMGWGAVMVAGIVMLAVGG